MIIEQVRNLQNVVALSSRGVAGPSAAAASPGNVLRARFWVVSLFEASTASNVTMALTQRAERPPAAVTEEPSGTKRDESRDRRNNNAGASSLPAPGANTLHPQAPLLVPLRAI